MDFEGINPALFTPLTDDGEAVAPERLRRLLGFLLPRGISGLFVCGTTGEGVYLTPDEREQVTEAVMHEVAGQVPVMVHVGAAATRDSVRLARHAERCGAAAVSSIPPFPMPLSHRAAIDHWTAIAAAVSLPMWIYYMPAMASFELGDAAVESLLTIPRLAGLKFTDPNLFVLRNLLDLSGGRLRVLSGPDELCLPAQVMGATGAIGSTYNWMAPLFVKLWTAWRGGDVATAQACQVRANELIRVILRYERLAGQKAVMDYLGLPCGPTRRPIRPLDEADRARLWAELDAAELRSVHA